jgi:cytochrome c peroxidase
MHDGRFQTVETVLEHYSSKVQNSPTLDSLLKQNGSLGIPLTVVEKQQIITFLKTLDDTQFIKDQRFSEQ